MKNGYRHELKYIISRASAEILRRRLPHFMARDPHAGAQGQYTIRSLYFDDFYGSAVEEKESGLATRTKYRLRCYNYDLSFVKLERKEKHGSLTKKKAQTLSRERALSLQALQEDPQATGLTLELQNKLRWEGLRPRVLVDYDRTPFVCADGNTRITLDENLRTRPYSADLLAPATAMIPVLEPEQVILEVKFDDFLPGYLAQVIGDIPKAPMAISKFTLCMQFL